MNPTSDFIEEALLSKDKAVTTIVFDGDWKCLRLTNLTSFDQDVTTFSFDDRDWDTIRLPHIEEKMQQARKYTSHCLAYCYRKRFVLPDKFDDDQQIYLHFEAIADDSANKNDDTQIRIPATTIWLNQNKIFSDVLPAPINLSEYYRDRSENLLVIYSKHGHRLRLHARLILIRRITAELNLDDIQANDRVTEGKFVQYKADFDEQDGVIRFFIEQLGRRWQAGEKGAANKDDSDEEKEIIKKTIEHQELLHVKTLINGPIPRLAILMLIVGTRGDVQPFIALAKALLACGHRVRLATHETFRKFVRENGIEFYPLGGNPADLMSFMVKNSGIVPSVSSIVAGDIAKSRRVMGEILASTWKACTEDDDETGIPFLAEAIIANPPSFGHIHCAQKLQIPLHIIFTMPWSPTSAFPHPLCKVDYNRAPIDRINMLSYDLVEVLTWSGMRNIINEFRKETLGLTPLHTRQAVRLMLDEHVPHTYCWSPSLVPKPKDWAAHIHVSGFFFLDLATNYKPPEDLVQFLRDGDPPIYIGFGSITGHDADRILQVVLEALQITGYRALLSGFEVDDNELPPNVLKIGNCPHDWLFQHVAAVCHHGGAGTTAAGLRAGKPTIIVPFFGDQFFWGSMIHKSGAGSAPLPGKTVTGQQLAEAFVFVHEAKTQQAAMRIATNFQGENGCEGAVESFHAHLPLSKLRSDLEPSFAACFRVNEYDLQISCPVAQVLITAGVIRTSDLAHNATYAWQCLMQNNPFQAIADGWRKTTTKIGQAFQRTKRSMSYSDISAREDRASFGYHRLEQPFRDSLQFYGVPKEITEEERQKRIEAHNGVKHSLRYGLACLVMRTNVASRRHSVANTSNGAQPSPRDKSPSKVPPKFSSQTAKKRSESMGRGKIINKTGKEKKSTTQSVEEKAAAVSGFSVDVCREILAEFEVIKNERKRVADDNQKTKSLRRLSNVLLRLHNRPDGSDH